ncbi:MAG TPA: hypothetical protein VGK24_04020 [Candidatus Angelobacter sp.]
MEKEADVSGISAVSGQAQEKTVQAMHPSPAQDVVQCVNIQPKGIGGLTHLVEMTREGHIYNEDWMENEREEVRHGDRLHVDLDDAWYSRRGIHQEIHWERDKTGEPQHLWLGAVELNGGRLGRDRYVRQEMLIDPILVQIPRSEEDVDASIDQLAKVLGVMGKQPTHTDACKRLKDEITGLKKELHITSAPVLIDLGRIGEILEKTLQAIEELGRKEEFNAFREALGSTVGQLRAAYGEYRKPKRQGITVGKISRGFLAQNRIEGIDIGGTGLVPKHLDVNINDEVNDRNFLVLGDAMNLQQSFEPDCTDSVIAQLLPLVEMEEKRTVEARIQVIARVLAGVNYICPRGTARIKFNDNTDDVAHVGEGQLSDLADRFGFNLELQAPVIKPETSALLGGMQNLKKTDMGKALGIITSVAPREPSETPSLGPAPKKPPESPPPGKKAPEGLYRFFTFRR